MKVYLVIYREYSDCDLLGVYSSYDKALECFNHYRLDNPIDNHEINIDNQYLTNYKYLQHSNNCYIIEVVVDSELVKSDTF